MGPLLLPSQNTFEAIPYSPAGLSIQGVSLLSANLQGADLRQANLKKLILVEYKSARSKPGWSNLEGAILCKANLRGADLTNAKGDEFTVMPDARPPEDHYGGGWKPGMDLARFTDPTHPNFWRPR
jgi:hypothetical protein